jgi:hypothetical protein
MANGEWRKAEGGLLSRQHAGKNSGTKDPKDPKGFDRFLEFHFSY